MKTELISFYSDIDDNTYYSDHAKRLKVQCDSLNIPTDFRHLDSLNDYRLNCLRKPKFILSVLEEKKKPIVWMDIDTEIHKELVVFDTIVEGPGDIGFAYTAMNREQLNPLAPKASPIFLKYNEIVLEFMNMWIDECQKSIDRNETFFGVVAVVCDDGYNEIDVKPNIFINPDDRLTCGNFATVGNVHDAPVGII